MAAKVTRFVTTVQTSDVSVWTFGDDYITSTIHHVNNLTLNTAAPPWLQGASRLHDRGRCGRAHLASKPKAARKWATNGPKLTQDWLPKQHIMPGAMSNDIARPCPICVFTYDRLLGSKSVTISALKNCVLSLAEVYLVCDKLRSTRLFLWAALFSAMSPWKHMQFAWFDGVRLGSIEFSITSISATYIKCQLGIHCPNGRFSDSEKYTVLLNQAQEIWPTWGMYYFYEIELACSNLFSFMWCRGVLVIC